MNFREERAAVEETFLESQKYHIIVFSNFQTFQSKTREN